MAYSAFVVTPDIDSELFEQVTDEESALLGYYWVFKPGQRAVVMEMLVRMVEPETKPRRRQDRI